jgi:hypothetical protein
MTGTVSEHPPDVAVPPFADPEQCLSCHGGVLTGCQAKPSREIARSTELASIADGGQERGRHQRSDSRDGHQPPGAIILSGDTFDLPGDASDPLVEAKHVLEELGKHSTHGRREIIGFIGEHTRQIEPENTRALADRNSVLEAEGTRLVDDARATVDELVAMRCSACMST